MDKPYQATILLADDQPNNLAIIEGYLHDSGESYRILKATNGSLACKIAEKRTPDLIIMDWEMPVMSGIEALQHLKSQVGTQDIPVIMATARTSSEDVKKALDSGAVDYIRKPVEKIELLARIGTSLKLSHSYKEIKRKNASLEELNREKDGMISIVAHDLRAPFNKIEGLIFLLSQIGELNDKQEGYIKIMKEVIQNGNHLIKDLLDVNTFEFQKPQLDITAINLQAFANDFFSTYQQLAKKKNQQIHIHLPQESITLHSDQSLLSRVLDNLLSNAIKFSPVYTNIHVKFFQKEENIHFSVKDEGPGISEEDQKKMFRKFQKLSAKPTGGESSTGLGLAIIKLLVEGLQGNITVKSEHMKGCEFIISLPSLSQWWK